MTQSIYSAELGLLKKTECMNVELWAVSAYIYVY